MWLLRGGSVTPFSTRFLSSRLVNFGLPFERCRLVLPCCCSLWFCSACLNCATGSSTRRQRLSFLRFSEEATDGNRLLLVVWGVFLPFRWISRLRGASQCREFVLPWDFLRGSVSSLSLQVMERAFRLINSSHSVPVFLLFGLVWGPHRSLHLDGLGAVGDCTWAMERFSHGLCFIPISLSIWRLIDWDGYKFWGDHQDLATPKATSIVPASEATRRTSPIYGYRRGLRTRIGSLGF